jgi:predicted transcriptional regulator
MPKKFSSQADPELLRELKEMSKQEDRQFQALLEEAIKMLIEQRKEVTIRSSVMAHYRASREKNLRLGELLAK